MTKDITTYQALLLEFDMACTESGKDMPSNSQIVDLALALDRMNRELSHQEIEVAVLSYDVAKGRY